MENHEKTPEAEKPQQDSVLLDVADMSGYDKNLKNARTWLYVLSGIMFAVGLYHFFQNEAYGEEVQWITFAMEGGIALVFLACTLWSYKKPATAFMTALVLYLLLVISNAILEPATIIQGIIFKILIVIALGKAYKDARENEDLKRALSAE